jgi:hypothetical protein
MSRRAVSARPYPKQAAAALELLVSKTFVGVFFFVRVIVYGGGRGRTTRQSSPISAGTSAVLSLTLRGLCQLDTSKIQSVKLARNECV